jgi:hypothetical protein
MCSASMRDWPVEARLELRLFGLCLLSWKSDWLASVQASVDASVNGSCLGLKISVTNDIPLFSDVCHLSLHELLPLRKEQALFWWPQWQMACPCLFVAVSLQTKLGA